MCWCCVQLLFRVRLQHGRCARGSVQSVGSVRHYCCLVSSMWRYVRVFWSDEAVVFGVSGCWLAACCCVGVWVQFGAVVSCVLFGVVVGVVDVMHMSASDGVM